MDDETYSLLKKADLKNVTLINMLEFEDSRLLAVKNQPGRNYFATVKPPLILYVLQKNPEIDFVTFIDSDLFFLSSPSSFCDKLGLQTQNNILITASNFTYGKEYLEDRNGIYNAGAMGFKNNEIGLSCLKDWYEKCIQSCENKVRNGHFGDQKYLDTWPKEFPGICFGNKGDNVGPWNVTRYKIKKRGENYYVDADPLILYHFSSLRIYSPTDFLPVNYSYMVNWKAKNIIYLPYLIELKKAMAKVKFIDPLFVADFDIKPPFWEDLKRKLKYDIAKVHMGLKEKVPVYSMVFNKYFKKRLTKSA